MLVKSDPTPLMQLNFHGQLVVSLLRSRLLDVTQRSPQRGGFQKKV